MTDEELRIKVAELCGLTRESMGPDFDKIPDYPNSLDAMHEAEGTLTREQQDQYIDNLLRLVVIPFEAEYGVQLNDTDTMWTILHANAQQRARAFVEALSR